MTTLRLPEALRLLMCLRVSNIVEINFFIVSPCILIHGILLAN